MTLADEIISGKKPNLEYYVAQGESIDDIDEYGFTPLIETAIVENIEIAKQLLDAGADIDKPDVTGRTALHWSVDNNNLDFTRFLLANGASPNAFTQGGQPVLVYPLLRQNWMMKQLLYRHNADLTFSQDFIHAKSIGHRFELSGSVDILNAKGEYIEVDFEGFILEFSLDMLKDSISRFKNNFAARHLRQYAMQMQHIISAFETAHELLKFQRYKMDKVRFDKKIQQLLSHPLLLLPIAYRGHAITFIKMGCLWIKCDRGENGLREGTVNLYYISNPKAMSLEFLKNLLYQRQSEEYVHHHINKILGLEPITSMPISPQVSGNCSWANVEASVPAMLLLQLLPPNLQVSYDQMTALLYEVMEVFEAWSNWDKDRVLNECLQSFEQANDIRRASLAAMMAAILFQSCDYEDEKDMLRAEKIVKILIQEPYYYILRSYLDIYCVRRLTFKGNNLLKILDDFGHNPNIGVNAVATGLKKKEAK